MVPNKQLWGKGLHKFHLIQDVEGDRSYTPKACDQISGKTSTWHCNSVRYNEMKDIERVLLRHQSELLLRP